MNLKQQIADATNASDEEQKALEIQRIRAKYEELRLLAAEHNLLTAEQQAAFDEAQLEAVIAGYPNAERFVWAQEEPRNMGAWSYMLQRFELKNLTVRSRKYYAVPAAGSSTRFKKRHRAVIDSVFNN